VSHDGERGFTLVELLISVTLSFIVLGATLTTFNNLYRSAHDNDARLDSAAVARRALDVQARQLRNLAKRVSSPVIDTATSTDIIFQTAEPTRTWVRYCLDTTTAPASSERGRLWTAELSVPLAATPSPVAQSMRTGCPGTGWTTKRIVADDVTNLRAGLARPLFEYTCASGMECAPSAATYDQVVAITARTIVDTTPGVDPREMEVVSAVNLRNQNQAPVANFAASASSATRTVVLNAAGSSDAEGRTLSYFWFKGLMPLAAAVDCARSDATRVLAISTLWGSIGFIGEGITLSHQFGALEFGSRNIGLVVCDPGDRYDTAGMAPESAIPVQIPS